MRLRHLILVIIPFFISCVDLYDPGLKSEKQRLVVESHLTTKLEYQYVYLTFDAAYNGEETNFKFPVRNAKINIKDDKGNTYEFFDELPQNNQIKTTNGYNYRSLNKFAAEVGRKYTLNIEDITGKKYVSEAELVLPAPKIANVKSVFKVAFAPTDVSGNFTISIDTDDPASTKNFYMWRSYHVQQINYCREWYIFGRDGDVTERFVDKCCKPCYEKVTCDECFEVANDRLINGKKIVNQYVANAPYKDSFPYYMVIQQYSLNENAFKYWNALKQQSKNSGGLFDATPQSLVGNIKAVANPSEEVLGYFTVSDVAETIYNVNRNLKDPQPLPYEEYSTFKKTETCFPCNESYNRTATKPVGFIGF